MLIAVWALMSAVTVVTAQKPIVRFEKDDITKSVNVQLANLMKNSTELAIQSAEGPIWFNKYILREHGYNGTLNLYGMPDGDYVVFVRNREGMSAQTFAVDMAGVEFFATAPVEIPIAQLVSLEAPNKLIYYLTDEGGMKIGVQLANLQQKPAKINIIAMMNGALYKKEVTQANGAAYTFNLEGWPAGDGFVYVRTHEMNLVQFFKLTENDLQLGTLQVLDHSRKTLLPEKLISNRVKY